jgi:hypothetical protein
MYVNPTTQRGVQKIFSLKIFSICHQCQRHQWCTVSCEYLSEFSKKFETALMVYSGARRILIHEKTKVENLVALNILGVFHVLKYRSDILSK